MTFSPPKPIDQRDDTATSKPKTPEYQVVDLVGADGEMHLRHNDQIYVLRITRAGKLILTK